MCGSNSNEKYFGRAFCKRRYHTVTVVEKRTYVIPMGSTGDRLCGELMDPNIPLDHFGPGEDRTRVIYTELNKEG